MNTLKYTLGYFWVDSFLELTKNLNLSVSREAVEKFLFWETKWLVSITGPAESLNVFQKRLEYFNKMTKHL
jgi:hypothetical protein